MEEKPATADPVNKPRRRWFSFSLRTLLVFVTLAGCGFGWFGLKVQEARRQQAAVAATERLGCDVGYDYQFDSQGDFVPNQTLPGPVWLHSLLGDDFFRKVYSVRGFYFFRRKDRPFIDADLELVKELTTLKVLYLWGTKVSDAGLANLQGLTRLEELDLRCPHVSDAGLDYLKGLTQLKELRLYDTQVSDGGVAKLQQALPNCNILWR
jgi:hypothetical protein